MAEAGEVELTRWGAQLADRAQEQRFRTFITPVERRAVAGTGVVILVIDVAMVVTGTLGGGSVTRSMVITQLVVAALLVAAGLQLGWPRARYAIARIYGAVTTLSITVAVMVSSGQDMALAGGILMVTGIALIYLTGRITLVGITIDALVFTAIIIPAWLAADPGPANRDVGLALVLVLLVHILGFFECRRAQRERRTLFAQHELLSRLASSDELTGLTNRRAFDEELQPLWHRWRTARTSFALIMLDIDHFKEFNDACGHPAGDAALNVAAKTIDATIPEADGHVAARYGGEEFMCLLPGTSLDEAVAIADRIRTAVNRLRVRIPGRSQPLPSLTMSAGVAVPDPAMKTVDDLVRLVDQRLYDAKRAGRDCVRPAPVPAV